MKITAKLKVTIKYNGETTREEIQDCIIELVGSGAYIYYKDSDYWTDEDDNMNVVRVNDRTMRTDGEKLIDEWTSLNGTTRTLILEQAK